MAFRFEPLLELRKNRENLVQRELGRVHAHLQTQQEFLDSIDREENTTRLDYDRRIHKDMDINTRILFENYFSALKQKGNIQNMVLSEASAKREKKRQELAEAVKKRKTLDILKEKDFLLSRKRALKKETEQMDEAAISKWSRSTL